jgi:hypothetical protein
MIVQIVGFFCPLTLFPGSLTAQAEIETLRQSFS